MKNDMNSDDNGYEIKDWDLLCHIEKEMIGNYKPQRCPELYHYTSPSGLKGILDSGKIWFTDADYLNDYSEGKYIIDILKFVIEEWRKDNPDESELGGFLDSIEQIHTEGVFRHEDKTAELGKAKVFLCCFSENQDSLPMWNYYVKNQKYQGYNMRFCSGELSNIDDHEIKLVRVIYDKNQQTNILYSKLEILKKHFHKSEEERNDVKYLFKRELMNLKYVFKNPCFAHEQEIRAMINVSQSEIDENLVVKYRLNENGIFVPYVEIAYPTECTEIMIAPLMNYKTAENSLKSYASKFITEVKIGHSKCPVRF